MRPRRPTRFPGHRQRGSLLIVAMIVSAIIAVSLASYIRLSTTTLRLASRTFLNISAVNAAEIGLEQALYSLNQNQANGVSLATAWTGWTTDSTAHTAKRTFTVSNLAPNTSATIRVYVENYDLLVGAPKIVAKATITPGDGSKPLEKFVEIQLSRRSLWGYGLVGKSWVHMNSNAKADSWISNPDNSSATAAVAYSAGVRRDRGSVGVVSATNGALALDSNAQIYGTANTGGGNVTTSSNARIYGATSPSSPKVDASRVNKDLSFTFPSITVPSPTSVNTITASWTNNTTLPRSGDVAEGGVYYYNFSAGNYINLDSNKTLEINQPIVFLFKSHTNVPSVVLSSNANVNVATTANVTIYTTGNITLNSNNNMNVGNQAEKCFIYGTSSTTQTFDFDSNVQLYGCIYAPNAHIQMDSNTDLHGAVIGNTIQVDSNAEFHYDESLANVGGTGGYRVSRWKELQTIAERDAYATALAF